MEGEAAPSEGECGWADHSPWAHPAHWDQSWGDHWPCGSGDQAQSPPVNRRQSPEAACRKPPLCRHKTKALPHPLRLYSSLPKAFNLRGPPAPSSSVHMHVDFSDPNAIMPFFVSTFEAPSSRAPSPIRVLRCVSLLNCPISL